MSLAESSVAEKSVTTGVSRTKDCATAALELYESVWRPDLELVLFFCSPQYDLACIETELARLFAGIELVGCTTAGEITPDGYIDGSITAVGFSRRDFTAVAEPVKGLSGFTIAAGDELVRRAVNRLSERSGERTKGATFAFLMIDGMSRQEEKVVSAIFSALGEIPLLGGSAGDDLTYENTHVFVDGRFRSNCAVLLLVHTPLPFKIFKTEHFQSFGERMVVTAADSDRRIVHELNAEPAAREYARVIGVPVQDLGPLVFAAHPLVVRVGGEYHVRSIQRVNNDLSLSFLCAIDEGIVLTAAESGDIVEDLETFMLELQEVLGSTQVIIGCDCILRRLEIERKAIKPEISDVLLRYNVIGFSTYGEQYNSMHVNQTFTGVAISSTEAAR